jgi:transposase-like protein
MSSRSNHVKRVHKNNVNVCNSNVNESSINVSNVKKYKCSYCNKNFNHRQGKWAHEQKCKEKNNKIMELKEEIVELKKQMNKTNIQNQNNNNGTINIDNSQKIINNFGSNNLDCLTEQFKKKLLKEFLFEDDYVNPIPLVIEKINFNPKYKENNNAKISNLKSKVGYKYTEGKWKAVEKDKLLNELVKAGGRVIDDYIDELEHIPENVQDGYDDFMSKKELLIKEIKTKIELACYLYFKNIEDDEYNNIIEV